MVTGQNTYRVPIVITMKIMPHFFCPYTINPAPGKKKFVNNARAAVAGRFLASDKSRLYVSGLDFGLEFTALFLDTRRLRASQSDLVSFVSRLSFKFPFLLCGGLLQWKRLNKSTIYPTTNNYVIGPV